MKAANPAACAPLHVLEVCSETSPFGTIVQVWHKRTINAYTPNGTVSCPACVSLSPKPYRARALACEALLSVVAKRNSPKCVCGCVCRLPFPPPRHLTSQCKPFHAKHNTNPIPREVRRACVRACQCFVCVLFVFFFVRV